MNENWTLGGVISLASIIFSVLSIILVMLTSIISCRHAHMYDIIGKYNVIFPKTIAFSRIFM